nr:extensin-like [Aegilops tauschii subsp. strangulata]
MAARGGTSSPSVLGLFITTTATPVVRPCTPRRLASVGRIHPRAARVRSPLCCASLAPPFAPPRQWPDNDMTRTLPEYCPCTGSFRPAAALTIVPIFCCISVGLLPPELRLAPATSPQTCLIAAATRSHATQPWLPVVAAPLQSRPPEPPYACFHSLSTNGPVVDSFEVAPVRPLPRARGSPSLAPARCIDPPRLLCPRLDAPRPPVLPGPAPPPSAALPPRVDPAAPRRLRLPASTHPPHAVSGSPRRPSHPTPGPAPAPPLGCHAPRRLRLGPPPAGLVFNPARRLRSRAAS